MSGGDRSWARLMAHRTDANLAAFAVALAAAEQQGQLPRLNIAAVAVDQAPDVERLGMLAFRTMGAQRVAWVRQEIAERA